MSVSCVLPRRLRAALLIGFATFAVAGCQSDRIVTGTVPSDYRDRHPIQINEGARSVQMFVGSGRSGLTPDQRALAGGFASQWRRHGSGPMVIEVPAGVANEVSSGHTVRELRSVLTASGVPPRAIQVQAYRSDSPSSVAPLRLSFMAINATVASRCHVGQDNLGSRQNFEDAQNYSARNFGCATQHNLAATVANPEDLVQPRAEQPGYAARRKTVLEKYRQGQDPSTNYPTATKASNVGP